MKSLAQTHEKRKKPRTIGPAECLAMFGRLTMPNKDACDINRIIENRIRRQAARRVS